LGLSIGTSITIERKETHPMTLMTITIPTELLEQRTVLQAQLAEIDVAQLALTAQKAEVESSLRKIDQVVRLLNGETLIPVAAPGVRRPMSEAGKANIRAALLKNAEAKRAAKIASNAPQPAVDASAPAPVAATVNDEPAGVSGPNAAARLAKKKK
jgi:hypothetical protein